MAEARATVGRWILRRMGPLFNWRSRIISRHYEGTSRVYDVHVRRAIEAIVDVFEGWAMAPDFARMEEMIAENRRIARDIAEIRARFGLDDEGGGR